MEAEATGVQEVNEADGPRLFCITSDSAVESRFRSSGNRCTVSIVESAQRVCLPTIFLYQIPKCVGNKSQSYSSISLDGNQETNIDTSNAGSVSKPRGEHHHLISQESLNLAQLLISGDLS